MLRVFIPLLFFIKIIVNDTLIYFIFHVQVSDPGNVIKYVYKCAELLLRHGADASYVGRYCATDSNFTVPDERRGNVLHALCDVMPSLGQSDNTLLLLLLRHGADPDCYVEGRYPLTAYFDSFVRRANSGFTAPTVESQTENYRVLQHNQDGPSSRDTNRSNSNNDQSLQNSVNKTSQSSRKTSLLTNPSEESNSIHDNNAGQGQSSRQNTSTTNNLNDRRRDNNVNTSSNINTSNYLNTNRSNNHTGSPNTVEHQHMQQRRARIAATINAADEALFKDSVTITRLCRMVGFMSRQPQLDVARDIRHRLHTQELSGMSRAALSKGLREIEKYTLTVPTLCRCCSIVAWRSCRRHVGNVYKLPIPKPLINVIIDSL